MSEDCRAAMYSGRKELVIKQRPLYIAALQSYNIKKMLELLQYPFFQNALAGSLLASILCAIVGTYIVSRRLVFISGGITHASFGGIGIGVYLGLNPIVSAMVFAIASAMGVEWMSRKGDVREDSAIAVFWTFGMSVGIICCFLSPGFMPDLSSYLFGNILTIDTPDLWLLGAVCLLAAVVFVLFWRQILSVAFDPVFARSQGQPVMFVEYGMMALVAMTIVSTLRMVGIVLAISLLTIPQMTANIFTGNFKRIVFGSMAIGWADCLLGLAISYWGNVPSGASIIFVSIVIYALAKAIKYVSERFNKVIRF